MFGAITALGVFCLSPAPKSLFESHLKSTAEKDLRIAGYQNPQVEMDHLHATVSIEEGQDAEKAAKIVNATYGIYVEQVTHHPKDTTPANGNNSGLANNPDAPTNPDKPDTPDNPDQPHITTVSQPTEFTIEWKNDTEINISGTLSNKMHLASIRQSILTHQKDAKINTTAVTYGDNVQNPLYLEETLTLIPYLTKNTLGKRSLSYRDPYKKQDGALDIIAATNKSQHKDLILRKIKAVESNAMKVTHRISYPASFTIIERPEKRKVEIIGAVETNIDLGLLESVVKVEDGYMPDTSKLKIDPNASSIFDHIDDATEKSIKKHLTFAEPAELTFNNGMITAFKGFTQNKDYLAELKNAYGDQPGISIDLAYREPPTLTDEQKAQLQKEAHQRATKRLKASVKEFKIYFGSGKSKVSPDYKTLLENTAQIIKESKDQTSIITIGGYADKSGDPTMNRKLSLRRAKAVQKKLIALGVPEKRTKVEFFGADELTPSKVESRRVELKIN